MLASVSFCSTSYWFESDFVAVEVAVVVVVVVAVAVVVVVADSLARFFDLEEATTAAFQASTPPYTKRK